MNVNGEVTNILHLSDFHLSEDNKDNFREIRNSINDAIEKKGIEYYPQIILVTGDFTEEGKQDEFKWFREGFNDMLKLKCFSQVKHIMLLAGNHDYPWNEKDTRRESFRSLCSALEKEVQVYSERDPADRADDEVKYIFIKGAKKDLLLLGLDSMKLDSQDWPGIGYFTKSHLRRVSAVIKRHREKNDNIVQVFAAFHHHLVPVSVLERDTLNDSSKYSLTLDARRAINSFLDNEVDFAVHGHQHQPSLITWKDDEREDGRELHIIAAGCLAGKSYTGEAARNSFMLYSVCKDRVIVNKAETSSRDSDEFEWKTVEYMDTLVHGGVNRKRILALAEQDDRWIKRADEVGPLTIRGLVENLVNSIADDGSVAYEVNTRKRYRTSTLATVLECMDDIGLLPQEDLQIMQRKLLQLRDQFIPIDDSDDKIEKQEEDLPAWGIDEAPSVWTTSKALTALFKTKFIPDSEKEKEDIAKSVMWLANQAYDNGGWGYQKDDAHKSCQDNVPMTALAIKSLSLALLDENIREYLDISKISSVLEKGLGYLDKAKCENRDDAECYWMYEEKANLSASIWALEAWEAACEVVRKGYYSRICSRIKPKVMKYVIQNMPEKNEDEKWTECFFRADKEDGLKYKPKLDKDKAFYSFTPYLISYYIKDDDTYISDEKVLSVIKWVFAHREDSWLIERNYNSKNACTISVAMAINVIVNWFKAKANMVIEEEVNELF